MRLLALLLVVAASASAQDRPNVLFIAVDDLRPDLGAYGNQAIHTPNLDALAASGVTFTRAYVQQAVCNPSRASLMTGLRPDSLRVWDLNTNFRDVSPQVSTLPQVLARQGMQTSAIGKIYHNIFPDTLSWSEPKLVAPGFPFDPDAVYWAPENTAIQQARILQRVQAGRRDRSLDVFGQFYVKANATESPDVPDDAYPDGAQTTQAVRQLEALRDRDEPFFFAVGYYRPHLPFAAPKRYWDLYDRDALPLSEYPERVDGAPIMAVSNQRELRGYADFSWLGHPSEATLREPEARQLVHGYYASVSYIDAQIGRLLGALDRLGLADNTIVVVWGDHGWKLGDHNAWGKMTNYEIDTRIPLLIRAPGQHAPGLRIHQLVEAVDLFPTVCDLVGVPVPADLEGDSVTPLLRDPDRPWKPAVFSQFLREGIWVAPDGVEYMGRAVRTERYRYVRWEVWETGALAALELYDHEADPGETVNVADRPEYAEALVELEAVRLAGWEAVRPVP